MDRPNTFQALHATRMSGSVRETITAPPIRASPLRWCMLEHMRGRRKRPKPLTRSRIQLLHPILSPTRTLVHHPLVQPSSPVPNKLSVPLLLLDPTLRLSL